MDPHRIYHLSYGKMLFPEKYFCVPSMQLRHTICVPILNDKKLCVFVIGVLERPP